MVDDAAVLALLAGVYACEHGDQAALVGVTPAARLYELDQLWADIGL